MKKRDKIIYWIATLWLALGMVSTGIVQLLNVKEEETMITRLGYPNYILPLLGTWKLLGVVAVLVPKFPTAQGMGVCGLFLQHVWCRYFSPDHGK